MKYLSVSLGLRTLASLILAIATCASFVWAQAATEYGMGVAKSATGAAGFGSALSKSMSNAASKMSSKMGSTLSDKTPNQPPSPPAASGDISMRTKSPQEAMKENRTKLEKAAGESGGTVHVTSVPEDATVYIDHEMVARTPAGIEVPAGNHMVTVSRPGSTTWTRDVTVSKGQDMSLDAKLETKYPSVVTLSWGKSN
jgi:hypothetical protein